MSKFILRFGTILLTFTIGVAGNTLWNSLGSVVERWIETPEPVLEEPCGTFLAEQQRLMPMMHSCGLLVVTIQNDGSITLYGEGMGTLGNTSKLVATLNAVFTRRAELRAYRPGVELNSDIPEEERIEKTVLIKAPRWLSYGEVSDLIDVIRATSAKPIGLVTEGSGYPHVTMEQNR